MNRMKSKLSYACGDIYGGGAFLVFSTLYMNFLVLVEEVPILAATGIILAGKIWDAVTDPIMGRLSDRTRTKYGRRRIYFLIGAVPVALSFLMMFFSFGIENMTAKIIYHTIAYMFFGTAFTIVMVPYNAILSDMTSDYNERTSYTTIRMLMSGAASLVCAVVPGIIIKSVGGSVNGPDQKSGYLAMASVLAAVFGACWLLTFWGTRERKDLPKPEKVTLRQWLSVFKNKPYRNFLGIFLSFQVAVDLVLAVFIFYIDLVVLKYKSYELIVGALLVFQMIFMIPQGSIAKKKGKAFPLYIGIPIWILTTLLFVFIDSTTPVYIILIFAVLIAVGASAGNLATWSMLADIYDLDEMVSGTRREGIFSGLTTFLRKAASGVAIFMLGIGLSALGFDQNEYNKMKTISATFNPSEYAKTGVVVGIKWTFIAIPVILLTVCLLFALKNKINKKRFDAVIKGLGSIRETGGFTTLNEDEITDIETATGVGRAAILRAHAKPAAGR